MLYARFQDTKEIEYNSFYIDLAWIYNLLDIYPADKVFNKHKISLSLRENISAEELFNQVLECKKNDNYKKVLDMTYKYKMKGVFAYDVNKIIKENNLMNIKEAMNYLYKNKDAITDIMTNTTYLVLFEGNLIHDFGNHGCLVKMNKIIKIMEE
ncbi:MAG TPA: hypothetical protein GXX63_09615 [Tissierellia bacterium]|nr:hypothetical protein [Tissierellia bacterium]